MLLTQPALLRGDTRPAALGSYAHTLVGAKPLISRPMANSKSMRSFSATIIKERAIMPPQDVKGLQAIALFVQNPHIGMKFFKDGGVVTGFRLEDPIGRKRLLSHLGESYATPQSLVPLHQHANWEFVLQIEGATSWRQGAQVCRLGPGMLLVCPPALPHAMAARAGGNFRFSYFGCSPALAFPGAQLEKILAHGRMTVLSGARALVPLVRRMTEEAFARQAHREEAIRLSLQQALIEVARLAAGSAPVPLRPSHGIAAQVQTMIASSPEQPWRLGDLARLVGYAPGYLATVFRRETGETVHAFVLRTRLEVARSFLLASDEPVTQIAIRLGFCSSQHFAVAFRRYFGVTARSLRPAPYSKRSSRTIRPPRRHSAR